MVIRRLMQCLCPSQGECSYETPLLPYLLKDGVAGFQEDAQLGKVTRRQKETKLCLTKFPHTSTFSVELDEDIVSMKNTKVAFTSPGTTVKDKVLPEIVPDSRHDNRDLETQTQRSTLSGQPLMDMDFDCILHSDEDGSPMKEPLDEEMKVNISVKDVVEERQADAQLSSSPHCNVQAEEQISEFEELFYLPKPCKSSRLTPFRESSASLMAILENVKQLLSKSPPRTVDVEFSQTDTSSNHERAKVSKNVQPHQLLEDDPFQINFCLEENYNDSDDDIDNNTKLETDSLKCEAKEMSTSSSNFNKSSCLPHQKEVTEDLKEMSNSPTWDEVFEDENEEPEVKDDPKPFQSLEHADPKGPLQHNMDMSVDLFGDDEAFLQVSLPDIQTPDKNFSNHSASRGDREHDESLAKTVFKGATDSSRISTTTSPNDTHPQSVQNSEHFNLSQDFFSVNFDLGYSLDDEDEDEVEMRDNLQSAPAPPSKPEHDKRQNTPHKPRHTIDATMDPHPVSISRSTSGAELKQKGETSALSATDYSILSPSLSLQQRLAMRSKTSTPSHVTAASHVRLPGSVAPHQTFISPSRKTQWSSSRKSLLQRTTLPADHSLDLPQPG